MDETWRLPEQEGALEDSLRTFLARLATSQANAPFGIGSDEETEPLPLPFTGESVDLLADSLRAPAPKKAHTFELSESVRPRAPRALAAPLGRDHLILSSESLPLVSVAAGALQELAAQVAPSPAIDPTVRLVPGAELAGYRIRGELGRGGMGAVFAAEDPQGRPVALKVVHSLGNARRLARLQREGQITAALDHPGIVKIHAAGSAEGVPYLVYELVPGARTLDQVWNELPREAVVALVRDAARALGHAHAHGVVHRDVKPENLLVDDQGRVRVADFGLATGDALGLDRMTRTGTFLGTAPYSAPEQLEGKRSEVGPRSDVWSLGVVLYEVLCGDLPYLGETFKEQLELVRGRRLLTPRQLDSSISPDLERVVLTALEPDPARRYACGEELARDLERVLAGAAPRRAQRLGRLRLGHAQRRALLAGAAGAAAFVAVVALGCSLRAPSPRLIAHAPSGSTAAPCLEGTVRDADDSLELRVAGRPVPVSADGAFSCPLTLPDGAHQVALELRRDGAVIAREERQVLVDTAAPRIELSSPALDAVSLRAAVVLRGRIEDASPCELSVAGRRVARVLPGQPFEVALRLEPGRNLVRLEARDEAGNSGVLERALWLPPAWYADLPEPRRAPLPLPRGVVFGEEPGEYLHQPSGAVLVFVAPGQRRDLEAVAGVAGTFQLGHRAVCRLTRGYFLGKREVSWGEYRRFAQATGERVPTPGCPVDDGHPVHGVSWYDAMAYCAWAGARLPSEAQWEYAAMGDEERELPWGRVTEAARCNLAGEQDGHAASAPRGACAQDRSPWGCEDMAGNVREWVADVFAPLPERQVLIDPTGPARGARRVIKGGGWQDEVDARLSAAKNARRTGAHPASSGPALGFRILVPLAE
ncbi:MAG: SUMF1/EgtB/PvdO family nonheme iron enzyme [Planctomycetota bacterium]